MSEEETPVAQEQDATDLETAPLPDEELPMLPLDLPGFAARSDDLAVYATARNWIGGRCCDASSGLGIDVDNPRHAAAMGDVVMSDASDVGAAVAVARQAQEGWQALPVVQRCTVLQRWARLLARDREELSWLMSHESGKTLAEARDEVDQAVAWLTYAAGSASAGTHLDLSAGVVADVDDLPVGIGVGVTPFALPLLGPVWLAAGAIALGNAFIVKPSEQTPFSALRLAALSAEAGLPDGVLGVVNGERGAVDALVDHPDVAAIALIGSSGTARSVYARAAARGKRVLCLGGAKNHVLVAPDADIETTCHDIVAAAFAHAGQHCFAASVVVAIGTMLRVTEGLVRRTQGLIPGADYGPLISAEAKAQTVAFIDEAERMGARVLVDGRVARADLPTTGHWLATTLLDFVTPEMGLASREVFGPVLAIVRADSLDAAIAVQRASPYAHATAIFTSSGGAARYATERLQAGFVGVNIAAPLPTPPASYGGWGDSAFGVGELAGPGAAAFWTRRRKILTRWPIPGGRGWVR